ncbi:MAG: nuclear transport factor 2 family protein [Novosphingobium sp.]|nr:nuclear transport factor 2 family protein [Novosphingobium sp.]
MHDAYQANIDLMNAYAHALDTRDWALFETLFTLDTEFAARLWEENAVPGPWFMEVKGRAQLTATLQATWNGLSRTHHLLSNYVVRLAADGNHAEASCYMRAHHVGNRKRAHLFEESLGRFDLKTVRQADGWKIARMEENIMVMLGTQKAFENPVTPVRSESGQVSG